MHGKEDLPLDKLPKGLGSNTEMDVRICYPQFHKNGKFKDKEPDKCKEDLTGRMDHIKTSKAKFLEAFLA